jgi:lysophospholipase L1-like esterase
MRVLILSGLAVLLAGEGLARWLTSTDPAFSYQFVSSALYRVDASGAVRHIPNHDFRVVFVHNDRVEYDERYRANNVGLIDSRDYPTVPPNAGGRRYAFVGDAFVGGIGADPWVPRLREALQAAGRTVDMYNLGVGGTSVQHFATLLRSVSRELSLTDIVLMPGSNNFLRPHWVPIVTKSEIRLCRPDGVETCIKRRLPILMTAFDEPQERIIEQTRERSRLAMIDTTPAPAWKRVARQSVLARELRDQARRTYQRLYPPPYDPFDIEDTRELPNSIQALTAIRSEFPGIPIHLVHFPQKNEITSRQYTLEVREQVEKLGISYFPALTSCSWTPAMYFPNDGHPSALGYQNMSNCVAKYLSLQ